MVTLKTPGDVPLMFTDVGEIVQVDTAGVPMHPRLTVPVKPDTGLTWRFNVALWPAVKVTEVGEPLTGPNEKSVALPDRERVCGLPMALSEIDSVALRGPPAVGLKVIVRAQLEPTATLAPQLFVSAKSRGFCPAIPRLAILSTPVPVLLSVTI